MTRRKSTKDNPKKTKENKPRKRRKATPKGKAEPTWVSELDSAIHPDFDPEVSPERAKWDKFWKEFGGKDFDDQVIMFHESIKDADLEDSELAFEMLCEIYGKACGREEFERFEGLMTDFAKQHPDLYEENLHYYLKWRLNCGLAAGHTGTVLGLANQLAELAGEDPDVYGQVVDQLAYHGQLSALVGAMRIAWPKIKESSNIVEWAVDECARKGAEYEVFAFLEENPSPEPDEPELVRRQEFYFEVDQERFVHYLDYLIGRAEPQWELSHFQTRPRRKKKDEWQDEWDEDNNPQSDDDDVTTDNFYHLGVSFLSHLHRNEGISYSKAELGQWNLLEYLVDRSLGRLDPDKPRDFMDALMSIGQKRPKSKPFRPPHILCPDRQTLDRFLGELLDFINPQFYKAFALFEIIPAWLRFLESCALIDTQRKTATLRDLDEIRQSLVELLQHDPFDPALVCALTDWN